MATATRKARATTSADRADVVAPDSLSMEFLVIEDNGGEYHWILVDRDGNSLARSPNFASYARTEDAAGVVLAGASSAEFKRPAASLSSLDSPSKKKVPKAGTTG